MSDSICDITLLLGRMKKADLKSEYAIKEEIRLKENVVLKVGMTDKQKRIRQLKRGFNTW